MSQDRRNWATSALCGGLARVIGRQRGEEGAEYDSYSAPSLTVTPLQELGSTSGLLWALL